MENYWSTYHEPLPHLLGAYGPPEAVSGLDAAAAVTGRGGRGGDHLGSHGGVEVRRRGTSRLVHRHRVFTQRLRVKLERKGFVSNNNFNDHFRKLMILGQ